jgi:N-acetylglucosamine malate deacetylase 1
MRPAIVIILSLLVFWRADYKGVKRLTRLVAVWLYRQMLARLARILPIETGATIVFAPHEDDETLGCGGLIAHKRNEGLPVYVVFITDGSASHPEHPQVGPAEMAARRRSEAREALAILGVETNAIYFLNAADSTLARLEVSRREILITRIGHLISQIQPAEIFVPCCPDGSTEHDAVFNLVRESLQRTRQRPNVWQYPVWSWWNPFLLLKHLFLAGRCYRLPLEDYHLIKERAMTRYRSQLQPLDPWKKPVIPPELQQVFHGRDEYFFHFSLKPSAPSVQSSSGPVI